MIKRLWTFATPPSPGGLELFLRRAEYLRLTDLALFVNGLGEIQFSIPAERERRLTEAALGLHRIGVQPHLVTWLRPSERYMTAAARRLRALCITLGVRSLLFDAEEPWTKHPELSGKGASHASTFLEHHWPFDYWPCPLGASGITYVPSVVGPLARRCQYVLPQAYSVARSASVYRPGVTQREAHERWKGFGKPIVMGLAAWNLNLHGGLSQEAAMQVALTAAEDFGINEVAYWSLRWLVKSAERTEFVRQAADKARRGVPQREVTPVSDREFAWH